MAPLYLFADKILYVFLRLSLIFERGFCCVAQARLELRITLAGLELADSPASASQVLT